VLWIQQVRTDRSVPNNRPHIIMRDNERRIYMLLDVAISGGRNVIKKESEILKYVDLKTAIQRMWIVKAKTIPITIGATGTVCKSFRQYPSNMPGQHEINGLHKTAILDTAHILRKVLM